MVWVATELDNAGYCVCYTIELYFCCIDNTSRIFHFCGSKSVFPTVQAHIVVVASSWWWSSSSRQILWNDCLPGVEQWGYEKSAVADRSRCKYRADPCLASAQYHLRCTLAHQWYNAYCVHTNVYIKYAVNRTRAERWSCKYSAIGALIYGDVISHKLYGALCM